MTPKEKADQLFDRMYGAIPAHPAGGEYEAAKACALVAVDEILSTIVCTPTDYGASWTYWQLVKIEINKL